MEAEPGPSYVITRTLQPVLYTAASVSGGIWKSTNLAITWSKINVENDNLYVSCMIQTPDGTIYAGTSESFAAQTMSGLEDMGYSGGFMGQGIFKSTDGENFSLLNLQSLLLMI